MYKKFTMKLKMNISVCIISLILVTLISIGKTSADPPKPAAPAPAPTPAPSAEDGIGNYGCGYFGKVDSCNKKPVAVTRLPKQCTSFIYNGLILERGSLNKNKSGPGSDTPPPGSDLFPSLNAVITSGKPVYLNIYHSNVKSTWRYDDCQIEALAESDADFLNSFMKTHGKIKGVIISDIDLTMYNSNCKDFETKLQTYVGVLKKECNIEVGVSIPATYLIQIGSTQNTGTSAACGADLSALDCTLDFYIITFMAFNKCGPDYVKGGTIPLDGSSANTLTNLEGVLNNTHLPKEKTYFKYPVYPIPPNKDDVPFADHCTNTITTICEHPQTTTLCAENSKSLREKGKFANTYGNGFIIDSVDLDDHGKKCHCDTDYPAFNLLIDGWTNSESYSECCLFDRV